MIITYKIPSFLLMKDSPPVEITIKAFVDRMDWYRDSPVLFETVKNYGDELMDVPLAENKLVTEDMAELELWL